MRVFIAGATGVLGRGLVQDLLARGHDVVGLARSEANERDLQAAGATPARASLFDAESLARAAAGADVVVRAATHVPKGAWTPDEIAQLDRVRREGTRALLEAAGRVGARKYVQESVLWVGEAGVPGAASAGEAERLAQREPLAVTSLRFGWFYGYSTAHTRAAIESLRAGAFVLPGEGGARKSVLHVEDAASAMAFAVEVDAPGVWEVVDEHPVTVAEFHDALASAVGAPPPRRGGDVSGFFAFDGVADAGPFRAATGWRPRYRTIREGLGEIAVAAAAAASGSR